MNSVKCGRKSFLISHQNSIVKIQFTHFISLRRWVSFFLCMLNQYNHLLLHSKNQGSEAHAMHVGVACCHFLLGRYLLRASAKISLKIDCWKRLKNYYLEVHDLIHFDYHYLLVASYITFPNVQLQHASWCS